MPYIEWDVVANKMYWYAIKTLITKEYEDDGVEQSVISMQNLKIVSCESEIIKIVCTDVFWSIAQHVNKILETVE